MPIKPLFPTEQDLLRARHVVRSLAPLKRLSSDDAEFVARAIAEIRTEGRAQGLEIAKDLLEHNHPDADSTRRCSRGEIDYVASNSGIDPLSVRSPRSLV
jgi:hypothetical protein